jgi:uncharacterized protein YuzE
MTDIKVTYDTSVNAAYLYLSPEPVRAAKTYPCDPIDVDGMINLDFDSEGRLIGIEVLAASSKLSELILSSAEIIG